MPLNFTRLLISFCAAILAFLATGIITYRAIETLVANQQRQVVARLIAVELQTLLYLTVMAETGQRGFVITGREAYLQPYDEAARHLPESIAFLRKNLAGDPAQLQRLAEIERLQKLKFAELDESIQARRRKGFTAAQDIVDTNSGKQYMDSIRAELATMQQIENARLRSRIAQSAASAERAYATVALASVLDVALLVLVALLVRSDARARAAAVRKLADAQELLRNVIDSSPALIYLTDPNGKFILVNEAFEEFAELAPGQAIGKSADEIFRERAAVPHFDNDLVVIQEQRSLHLDEAVLTREGKKYLMSSKVLLRDHAGAPIGVCGVSTDVTTLKLAEAEVRALNLTLEERVAERTEALAASNEQLHEANSQLEAFSYTVAHDLRAPLRGMQGFAQAVSEDYSEALDATGQDYLARISRAARRMERLIDDLLSFGRLSRLDLKMEKVELDEIAAEALALVATQVGETGAQVEIAPRLHTVEANHAACIQILQNLLSNALKFTRPGTPPVVRIWSDLRQSALDGGDESHARTVRLWVSDNGIGIPEMQLQRIFRPFERLHGIHEYQGSGIGLAVIDQTVRRMNGSCGVESELDKGSRFWVELPAAEGENG
ncbi:MAG: His Kinase (Phospho-acceptor) protein [Noviherbaspirillum sp.]|nr:His Kinase (Phospho-acceptor) protein [Noviherbaspirillum sp.]